MNTEYFQSSAKIKVLLIDHYDSFADMIADYLRQLACDVIILKSDQITAAVFEELNPDKIIIGPGPGHPSDNDLISVRNLLPLAVAENIPILGICLGHQIIAEYYGARVVRAQKIAHGVCSDLFHNQDPLFVHIPDCFSATRYHSLIVDSRSINETPLRVLAKTEAAEIMALRHETLPLYGIQFHPESIMTYYGMQILTNFINL